MIAGEWLAHSLAPQIAAPSSSAIVQPRQNQVFLREIGQPARFFLGRNGDSDNLILMRVLLRCYAR